MRLGLAALTKAAVAERAIPHHFQHGLNKNTHRTYPRTDHQVSVSSIHLLTSPSEAIPMIRERLEFQAFFRLGN
jgi:hypothetical protein